MRALGDSLERGELQKLEVVLWELVEAFPQETRLELEDLLALVDRLWAQVGHQLEREGQLEQVAQR